MVILQSIRWVLKRLETIQKIMLFVVSILLVLGVTGQVILRYVLKSNLLGLEEMIILLAFWLYFLGGIYGSATRTHITADLTEVYIKNKKLKQFVKLIVSLITVFISCVFAYYSVDYLTWGVERGATSPVLKLPMVWSQSSVFVGFTLMAFYFIVHFVKDLLMFLNISKDGCG